MGTVALDRQAGSNRAGDGHRFLLMNSSPLVRVSVVWPQELIEVNCDRVVVVGGGDCRAERAEGAVVGGAGDRQVAEQGTVSSSVSSRGLDAHRWGGGSRETPARGDRAPGAGGLRGRGFSEQASGVDQGMS